MKVIEYKATEDNKWAQYEIAGTYRVGWLHMVLFAKVLYTYLENPEVSVYEPFGEDFKPVAIKEADDLLKLEEGGALEIKGVNTSYGGVPFVFRFYDRQYGVHMLVPLDYLNSLKICKTELLDENEKLHVFDWFLDSLEYKMAEELGRYDAAHNGEGA